MDGSRKACGHGGKLTSVANDRWSKFVRICCPNGVEPGAGRLYWYTWWGFFVLGSVNVWNQKNQHRSNVPMAFEEEYRDMSQMSCVFLSEIRCGHAWARAVHPFSDQLSQPEAFNAPVARGRNMCCVAHWARWGKSLKCLKDPKRI